MNKHRKLIYGFVCFFIVLSFTNNQKSKGYFTFAAENEKIIYLTFDDGPSIMMNRVLDILKENNVHGTFFVIGNQIKGYEEVLKRSFKEKLQ